MNQGAGPSGRYAAFLSYSHRDSAHARALHRRLEVYRLPRRLVGTEGEHGPVPARLTPIFRDREEFPAAGDLSEKVRAALAASESLIVLCSPHSAASPWVAKEIAAFRELHPSRPILAAIVDGEPPHCFPVALMEGGAEPLATDLRPNRDGRRLGLLKLVAGLAGVGTDALIQRDTARRLRRVTAVTAGALAAMLVMAVMTAMALTARAEAERQRAEAEGLIEFMLTDLRDRLRQVGRLDVMQAVNRRAVHYYRGREAAPPSSAQSGARQARIFQAVGEDHLEKDDLDGALAAFRKASEATRRELALFPADPQLLLDRAKGENGIGRVHAARDEWDAAERRFRAFAAATEPLAASVLGEAAAASVNLGNVARDRKDHASAEHHYGRAVQLLETAVDLKKDDTHLLLNLANAQAWLADIFYRRSEWARSLQLRRRQLQIVKQLRDKEPESAEAEFRYAAAQRGLACSLWHVGDRNGAAPYFIGAYEAAAGLGRRDPQNAQWRGLRQKLSRDLLRGGIALPDAVPAGALNTEAANGKIDGCTG